MNQIPLEGLMSLFNEAFPVYPNSSTDIKRATEQFYAENIGSIVPTCNPLSLPAQGDVVTPIVFINWSHKGEPTHFEAPGMIITSTCDLDRKDNIVFCPCYSLDECPASLREDISKNRVYEYFFIGNILDKKEWCVDLSYPMTLPRERILHKIDSGDVKRVCSLTQRGWYLFITKFSIKYFRPDDTETMAQR